MSREKERLLRLKSLSSFLDGVYDIPINQYTVKEEIKKLEDWIDLKEELEKLDLFKEYSISKYFNLVFSHWQSGHRLSIYLKGEYTGVMYNNFIGSNSGMNEWSIQHTKEIYDFLAGNSEYNHALGTVSLTTVLERIENMNDADKIESALNEVITYFNEDKWGKVIANEFDHMLEVAFKEAESW